MVSRPQQSFPGLLDVYAAMWDVWRCYKKKTWIEQWSSFPGAGNVKLSLPDFKLMKYFDSICFHRHCLLVDIGLTVSLLHIMITSVFWQEVHKKTFCSDRILFSLDGEISSKSLDLIHVVRTFALCWENLGCDRRVLSFQNIDFYSSEWWWVQKYHRKWR